MTAVHVDTDFLIVALSGSGPERRKLVDLNAAATPIHMSAVAWYEFAGGPRTPEQLATARFFLDSIIAFDFYVATAASVVFRELGSPRRRSNDIAIGVTASTHGAALLTLNSGDFSDIPELRLA